MRIEQHYNPGIDGELDKAFDILKHKTIAAATSVVSQIQPTNILLGSIASLAYSCCSCDAHQMPTVFIVTTVGSALIDKINIQLFWTIFLNTACL